MDAYEVVILRIWLYAFSNWRSVGASGAAQAKSVDSASSSSSGSGTSFALFPFVALLYLCSNRPKKCNRGQELFKR